MLFFKVICITILSTLSVSQLWAGSYPDLAAQISKKAVEAGYKRLAVAGFTSVGVDKQTSEFATDDLIFYLVERAEIEVVEREQIDKLLKEKSLEQVGLVDEKQGAEVGKWLNTDAILIGKVSERKEGQLTLQLRLVDVKTARISATFRDEINSIPVVITEPDDINEPPKIQVAILLDTSSSMDGLINQTRAYLWKMVNELADASKDDKTAKVEVALYEYGKSTLPEQENYLRMILPFTEDLDKVSEQLFALQTTGGEEYAGAVIEHATQNLIWSKRKDNYRTIFIAGNEGFGQGKIPWENSIANARRKGVFVNTIFCGSRQEGEGTGWAAGARAGAGSFSNIEQNSVAKVIDTPFDAELRKAGQEINSTFIPYGKTAKKAAARQAEQDEKAATMADTGADLERYSFKGKSQYSSQSWDLVTGVSKGELKLNELEKDELPPELAKLSKKELQSRVESEMKKRQALQKQIAELTEKRQKYIAEESAKLSKEDPKTLDKALVRTVLYQAKRQNFNFKP